MNQDQTARRICQLLDQAADNLPLEVQARLSAARHRALDRFDTLARQTRRPRGRPSASWTATFWARFAAAVIPVFALLAAVLVGNLFGQQQTVIARADAYTEMLTAEPPLAAYTDPGFATHLQRVSLSATDANLTR